MPGQYHILEETVPLGSLFLLLVNLWGDFTIHLVLTRPHLSTQIRFPIHGFHFWWHWTYLACLGWQMTPFSTILLRHWSGQKSPPTFSNLMGIREKTGLLILSHIIYGVSLIPYCMITFDCFFSHAHLLELTWSSSSSHWSLHIIASMLWPWNF